MHFDQLNGQVEVALDVGSVDDIDDAVRLFVQHEVAGYDFFGRIRPEGIDPRHIDDRAAAAAAHFAGFDINRHARKIAHMLIGACKLIEKRRFSAVLIADQRELHPTASTSMFFASSRRRVNE